jgi:hypothetical protein
MLVFGSDSDPDPDWAKMLDPDPDSSQSGSTTLQNINQDFALSPLKNFAVQSS